jgi:hypothetical protein
VNKLAVIVMLVGLAACSKKKDEEGREPAQTAAPGPAVGGPASGAPAPGPATGSAGATVGSAAPASAASSYGVGCATATAQVPALVCDAGLVDGCTGGLTSVHACVAKDAKAGPPCAQGPALTCPAGQADACVHEPPQASNHVCVAVPKPTP